MANKKNARRAFISSVISLILCCSMLVGTTFAWFTDSVTSAGNIIKSGTLDVTMEWKDATANGAQQVYKDASEGAIFNYDLWEPGYIEAKNVKISNKGTLALKYQLKIVANGEVSKLADVIDVYYAEGEFTLADRTMPELTKIGTLNEVLGNIGGDANGELLATESDTVTIALKMQESAGNEYQNLAIGSDFSVILLATQETYEKDSFDDQYDKDAEFAVEDGIYIQDDGNLKVLSQEGLSKVAELASEDDTITSVTYNNEEVPVVRDTAAMNTELAEGATTIVLTEGTYTVGATAGKDVTIAGTENTMIDVTSGLTYVNGAKITFEGVTIQSEPEGAGYTNGLADAQNTVFNNCVINGTIGLDYSCEFNKCEFNISGDYYNVWTWGAGTVTFNGCTFNCDGKALLVYANVLDNGTSHQTVNITNCVFNDNGDDTITGKAAIEITDTYPANNITYDVIINNTTVNGFSVTTQNATTFGGTDLGTNVWGNKNLLTTDDLNVVIDGVDVH